MKLAPREEESLLVHQVGSLAQKRLARGVRLNYTEATALIACQVSRHETWPQPQVSNSNSVSETPVDVFKDITWNDELMLRTWVT